MQNLQHFIIFLPLCAVESNEERVIGSSSSNIVILFFLKSVVIWSTAVRNEKSNQNFLFYERNKHFLKVVCSDTWRRLWKFWLKTSNMENWAWNLKRSDLIE